MMKQVKFLAVDNYDEGHRKRLIMLNEKIKKMMEDVYKKEKFSLIDKEEILDRNFINLKRNDLQVEIKNSVNDSDINSCSDSDQKIRRFNENNFRDEKKKIQNYLTLGNNFESKSRNKKLKIRPIRTLNQNSIKQGTNFKLQSSLFNSEFFIKTNFNPKRTNFDIKLEEETEKEKFQHKNLALDRNSPIKIISSLIKPTKTLNNNKLRKYLTSTENENKNFSNDKFFLTKNSLILQDNIKKIKLNLEENIFKKTFLSNGEDTKSCSVTNSKSRNINFLTKTETNFLHGQSSKKSNLKEKRVMIQKVISGIYSQSIEDDRKSKKIISHTLDAHTLNKMKRSSIVEILKMKKDPYDIEEYYKIFKHNQIENQSDTKEIPAKENRQNFILSKIHDPGTKDYMKKVYSVIKYKDRFAGKFIESFDEEEEEKKLNCVQVRKKIRKIKISGV